MNAPSPSVPSEGLFLVRTRIVEGGYFREGLGIRGSSQVKGEKKEKEKRMEMAGCKKNGVIMTFMNTMIKRSSLSEQ